MGRKTFEGSQGAWQLLWIFYFKNAHQYCDMTAQWGREVHEMFLCIQGWAVKKNVCTFEEGHEKYYHHRIFQPWHNCWQLLKALPFTFDGCHSFLTIYSHPQSTTIINNLTAHPSLFWLSEFLWHVYWMDTLSTLSQTEDIPQLILFINMF